ncbi:zeta toxin family protein [Undibacterium sp.]|uniref:zeta toxin family protein n=1 Tax=Undibacterium sp. TaxID=1914977 RepID=UPI0037515B37
MLRRLDELTESGRSFASESTLSSRTFSAFLENLKAQGYRINLCYVRLISISLTQERIALQVKMSGHTIPPDVIARRYARSMQNFGDLPLPLADNWSVFDNADINHTKIAVEAENVELKIFEEALWNSIKNQ